jgi:hypothetical protein
MVFYPKPIIVHISKKMSDSILKIPTSLIFAFIAEPITVWLGIYRLDNWSYIYSLPIYIIKAVLIKALVQKVTKNSLQGGAIS